MAVTHWTRAGMPKTAHGKYPLRECVQWRLKQLEVRQKGGSRGELVATQIERQRIEIAKLRGTLIDADTLGRVLNETAVIYSTHLDGLGPRVAAELAELTDQAAIQAVIFREARAIRAAVAAAIATYADREAVADVQSDQQAPAEPVRRPVGRPRKNTSAGVTGAGAVAQ